jgi:peptide/nickel transport system substrate-binding protein
MRRETKRVLGPPKGPAAACILLAIALGGCREPPSPPERTLTFAIRADVRGIYPQIGHEFFSFTVNSNIFEGLTRLDRTLKAQPAVASSWESPDEDTWIFHLPKDARFSDGSPLVAKDVVASILFSGQRLPAPDYFLSHESVEALADDLVRIRTRRADPLLLAALAQIFILPAKALAEAKVPPIGTGPYVVEHWTPGRELVLVRNPYRQGPHGAFSRVRYLVLPNEKDRVEALLRGKAQIAEQLSPLGEGLLQGQPAVRLVSRPGLRVLFLVLRMNEKPLSDPRVREALDLALDRDAILRGPLEGKGIRAEELVPPGVMGYDPDITLPLPDRKRARALLKEAGYPNGFSIRLDGTNDHYQGDARILEEVARQLATIGVTVEVNALPKEPFFALQESFGSRFYLFGWSSQTLQAGESLEPLAHTPNPDGLGSENTQFLSDPALDALIDEAHGAASLHAKALADQKALRRLAEIRAILPLVIPQETFGIGAGVVWEPPLDGALRAIDVSPALPR